MDFLTPRSRPRLAVRTNLTRWLRHLSGLLTVALLACGGTTGDGRCADGRLACADECVDEMASLLHCGACGTFCQVGEDCVSGACSCVSGQTPCGAGCVDLSEDAQNCGACGTACAPGEVCSGGVCTSSGCGLGLLQCGQSCANPVDSVQYCGGCEGGCEAGQLCQNQVCACTQGRQNCGSGCSDLAEDPLNCGQCGVICPVGSTCSEGGCETVQVGVGGSGSGGAGVGGSASGGAPGVGGGLGTGGSSGPGSGGAGSGGAASGGQGPGSGGQGPGSGGTPGSGGSSSGGSPGSGGSSGCDATGFYVENELLFDANCNEFIMRGVNYPYAWYSSRSTQSDFSAIAATGANVVRIVLSAGRWNPATTAANVESLIGWAKSAQLIAMLEVHDTTGYSDTGAEGSVPLSTATSFWTNSAMVAALQGEEAYVLVNIGNEPNGNNTTTSWVPSHVTAVQALRNAGLTHTLVVDAPNWGQDWQGTMMAGDGNAIWDADSLKNLVFSVHMYQEFSMASDVTTYVNTFLAEYEAPLIIGEFAADHGSQGDVAEATILSTAESLGLGYLGWSWSGNGSGLETLDITQNFNASSLTSWGNTLVNGANGLQATGEVCTIFQ